eukprot:2241054-Ditylum_brightwellii.AAC.1
MKRHRKINVSVSAIHPGNTYLPPFVKSKLKKQDKSITTNTYDKHNIKDMVQNCAYLSVKQRQDLIHLFSDYKDLFGISIGTIPGKPVSLELKPSAKLFCAQAYTVPMAIECITCNEIKKLCELDVLGRGSNSAWGVLCLFQAKRMAASDCSQTSASSTHALIVFPTLFQTSKI